MAAANNTPLKKPVPVNGAKAPGRETPAEPPLCPVVGWGAPGAEVAWLPAPLRPPNEGKDDPVELLHAMPGKDGAEGEKTRLAWRKWFLDWILKTRVFAAVRERDERVRAAQHRLAAAERAREEEKRELRSQLEQLKEQEAERVRAISEEEAALAKALTESGVEPCEPTVTGLAAALERSAPSLEVLDGAPRPEEGRLGENGRRKPGGAALVELFLGFPAGAVLAVCLGTLLGFLSIVDLQRADRWPKLLGAALIGWSIVFLLGKSVERTVRMVGREKERGMAWVSTAGVTLLVIAEILAEAYGMRDLQLQRVLQAARMQEELHLLPWVIYGLLGLLVSGPYVLAKATGSWESRRVRAFTHALLFEQREQQEARLKMPSIQRAYAAVLKLGYFRRERERQELRWRELEGKLEALQGAVILDEPWVREVVAKEGTAIDETEAFQGLVRELVEREEGER